MRQIRTSIVSAAAVCAALAASALFAQEERPAAQQETRREAAQQEAGQARQQAEQARQQAGEARQQAEQARQQAGQARQQAGQATEREANFPPREQSGGGQAGGINDQLIAKWLIVDNQGEIALAEFAQEQAQSEQVRQFAEKMVQDHKQFVQQLQRAAGQQGGRQLGQATPPSEAQREQQQQQQAQAERRQPAASQRETAQTESAQPQRTAGFRPGQSSGSRASDVAELKQQLGQKHTASLREELGRYQGADFDKAFMHTAAMAHVKMIDTLEVFQQNASPELRETLAQGLQTTQHHLEMAKQIRQQLEQQGSSGQSQRGQQSQPRRQQSQQREQSQPREQPQDRTP